jgi:predicted ATPase
MSEKSDNICIELHTMIDDADRRITDLNANRFGAPGVRILATSREPLHVEGERRHRL